MKTSPVLGHVYAVAHEAIGIPEMGAYSSEKGATSTYSVIEEGSLRRVKLAPPTDVSACESKWDPPSGIVVDISIW